MGWVGSGHTKWTHGQLCAKPTRDRFIHFARRTRVPSTQTTEYTTSVAAGRICAMHAMRPKTDELRFVGTALLYGTSRADCEPMDCMVCVM